MEGKKDKTGLTGTKSLRIW